MRFALYLMLLHYLALLEKLMRKLLPILAVTFLFWVGLAEAHGPTREKFSESIDINAAPEAVWALVGDYAHPEKWMPTVESTTAQGGTEKGATRELKLKSGGTIKEELKNYDAEKKVIQYKVDDPTDPAVFPVNNYSSTIKVEANPAGGSKVEWNAAFYRWFLNNNPPEGQNEAAAKAAVEKVIKESLTNLKAVAEQK
jgi:carbon monoxide dehydrogenase subunit G